MAIHVKSETTGDILIDYGRSLFFTVYAVTAGLYLPVMYVYLLARLLIKDRFWLTAFFNNFLIYSFLPLLIILPLGVILRKRWVLMMAIPLAVIGLLSAAPYYMPKSIISASNPMLRVVSFNTWRGNTDLTAVKEWLRGIDANVVLLQEVVNVNLTDGEIPDLADLYPYQHSQFLPEGRWGNVTLSRYPILKVDNLDNERGDTFATQQRFELDMNGQTIVVYNVHFARPLTPNAIPRIRMAINNFFVQGALVYEPTLRNRQIQKFLDEIENENHPYIVAGDFNMSDQTQLYGEIAARLRDSFSEVGSGLGGSWPLAEAEGLLPSFFPPLLRFDYIWHNDGFRAVQIGQGPRHLNSDHLPIYATLELAPGT